MKKREWPKKGLPIDEAAELLAPDLWANYKKAQLELELGRDVTDEEFKIYYEKIRRFKPL